MSPGRRPEDELAMKEIPLRVAQEEDEQKESSARTCERMDLKPG